jgi:hypothetical protein
MFNNSSGRADGRGRKMAPVIEVSGSISPLRLSARRAVRAIEAISRGAAMMRAMKECIVERHLARAPLRHRAAPHLPLVLATGPLVHAPSFSASRLLHHHQRTLLHTIPPHYCSTVSSIDPVARGLFTSTFEPHPRSHTPLPHLNAS